MKSIKEMSLHSGNLLQEVTDLQRVIEKIKCGPAINLRLSNICLDKIVNLRILLRRLNRQAKKEKMKVKVNSKSNIGRKLLSFKQKNYRNQKIINKIFMVRRNLKSLKQKKFINQEAVNKNLVIKLKRFQRNKLPVNKILAVNMKIYHLKVHLPLIKMHLRKV